MMIHHQCQETVSQLKASLMIKFFQIIYFMCGLNGPYAVFNKGKLVQIFQVVKCYLEAKEIIT